MTLAEVIPIARRPREDPSTMGQLGEVLTIQEVAKRTKRSVSSIRRFLVAKNKETGGELLVNMGQSTKRPRWTISTSALHSVARQWFVDSEEQEARIEYLTARVAELVVQLHQLQRRLDLHAERLADLAPKKK